jgi:hypothetical protein
MKRYDKLDKERPKPNSASRARTTRAVALVLLVVLAFAFFSHNSSSTPDDTYPVGEGAGEFRELQLRRMIIRATDLLDNKSENTTENISPDIELDWTDLSYSDENEDENVDSDADKIVGVLRTIEIGEREKREFFGLHKIVHAWYGPEGSKVDDEDALNFIDIVKARVKLDGRLVLPFDQSFNQLAGQDPSPGKWKKLYVQYDDGVVTGGKVPDIKMQDIIMREEDRKNVVGVKEVEHATYGVIGESGLVKDVTKKVKSFFNRKINTISFTKCFNCLFGDPAPGRTKELHITFLPINGEVEQNVKKFLLKNEKKIISKTCNGGSGGLRFIVTGDWGSNSVSKKSVAEAMKSCQASLQGHFVISVGDHFYPNGVTSEDDRRFTEDFEDFF